MSQWTWHYAPPKKEKWHHPSYVEPRAVRCENCGRVVKVSDWPFCPHGKRKSDA